MLGSVAVRVEHIGSTAVPGLGAKPKIDVDVVVRSHRDVATAIDRPKGDFIAATLAEARG